MAGSATASAASECHTYVALNDFDWTIARTGPLPWSPGVYSLIAAFSALTFWSTIHITLQILFFFKRYKGLYFWSLMITTWALTIRELGFLLKYVAPQVPWEFTQVLVEVGWTGMVTGYALVLWSRLSIIVDSRAVVRAVLAVIVVDGFIFHTALWIVQFGLASAMGSSRKVWLDLANPWERIQISAFTLQESGISVIYMWGVWRLLKEQSHRKKRIRQVLSLLFVVQVITIAMDIIITVLDLAGYFTLKAIIHSWVYALKLELEFVVLNQLVDIAKTGVAGLRTITDDNVPNLMENEDPSTSSTPETPSPGRQVDFQTKPDWLVPMKTKNATPETKVREQQSALRRMSSPAPLGIGSGIIPEDEIAQLHALSFQDMLAHSRAGRSPNLSGEMGVIPDA